MYYPSGIFAIIFSPSFLYYSVFILGLCSLVFGILTYSFVGYEPVRYLFAEFFMTFLTMLILTIIYVKANHVDTGTLYMQLMNSITQKMYWLNTLYRKFL